MTSLKSVPATRFQRFAQKLVADVERKGLSKWGESVMLNEHGAGHQPSDVKDESEDCVEAEGVAEIKREGSDLKPGRGVDYGA